jgi:flagellar motor switch protein FliG
MNHYVESEHAHTSGAYKGAVVLTALGMELSARVLSHLSEGEVDTLIQSMATLGYVPMRERDRVLQECEEDLHQHAGAVTGGPEYTRRFLEQAVGVEKAANLLERAMPGAPKPLTLATLLKETPPESLCALVADEHPQTIALLVSQLPLDRAGTFLQSLPEALQGPVTARLVQLETPAPRAIQHLERCLVDKLGGAAGAGSGGSDGPRRVADILGRLRRSVENSLLSSLEKQSPDLLVQVNRHRFTFEQLLEQDDRTLQRVLRETDGSELPLVIKGLDDTQQEKLYRNMSERAAERLREDVANLAGVRLRDVELAQQGMVNAAKALQERGEVTLRRAGAVEEEETLV